MPRSPRLRGDPNLNSAQVCARDLRRAQWPKKCHQPSVGDTSHSLPHSPLPSLSGDATKAVKSSFLASNLANLTHGSCLLQTSSLSASHCLSFCLTLPLGHHVEGSLPQIPPLTSSEGGLCHRIYRIHLFCSQATALCLSTGREMPLLSLWIGLLDLCHSLLLNDSLCGSDGSLRATCALLRHDFFVFVFGGVMRTQPLPDTSMTIGKFQEDALKWASDIKFEKKINSKNLSSTSSSDIEFEEITSTNPFLSSSSPHSPPQCGFATACTLYATFNPCLHSTEQADPNI